jgi:hypothetical protein
MERAPCYDASTSLHQSIIVRTTLDLTDTALEAARQLATHRAQSLGTVVSELILKGLRSDAPVARKTGFPVFAGSAGKTITLDDVKSAEDEP